MISPSQRLFPSVSDRDRCGPCKVIAPKVVEFSKEFPDVDFIKVDVDDLSDVAAEYSIRAMPTFLLFKGGEKVAEVVGANAAKRESTPPFSFDLFTDDDSQGCHCRADRLDRIMLYMMQYRKSQFDINV